MTRVLTQFAGWTSPATMAVCCLASLSCSNSNSSFSEQAGQGLLDASSGPNGNGGSHPTGGAQLMVDASLTGDTSSKGGGGRGGLEGGECVTGQPCEDGGVCAAGACCPADGACGDICCSSDEVCSFLRCVAMGASCTDSSDCSEGEYCESTLRSLSVGSGADAASGDESCIGGAALPEGRCIPRPPICAASREDASGASDPGAGVTCMEKCEYHPSVEDFRIQLAHSWTAPGGATSNIMMTPIVVQLDDDDCDGKVTERDIPDILFSTYPSNGNYNDAGVLYAISIVKGIVRDKWHVSSVVYPTKQLAGGNLDGSAGAEVVACGADGKVHAFRANGDPYWTTTQTVECFMPSIADMDGDGRPEVIVEGGILNGQTGAMMHALSKPVVGPIVVSDIDGNGKLDVVTASQAFRGDGSLLVETGLIDAGEFRDTGDWKGPWPAIGDFDADGKPEVVAVDNKKHMLSVWRYDSKSTAHFTLVRDPIDINGTLEVTHCREDSWGRTHGGGAPTVGDFNGDGVPDVAVAGGVGYAVFDGGKLVATPAVNPLLWALQTHDCSSASTGSSLFDFNGDGRAEVIYSDEEYLRVYEGDTGQVLEQQCNSTGTLAENPIVADVDNDGQADIVVPSNDMEQCGGGSQSGLRVFGSASGTWVRTRRVWNEHAYHITNVGEDGTIPSREAPNWTQPGLNNFRQNKQPGQEFAAPDAVVSLQPSCGDPSELVAVVRNMGEAALPAGVGVKLAAVAGSQTTPLAAGTTSRTLYPAQAEPVKLAIPPQVAAAVTAAKTFSVTVEVDARWHECRTDNNGASIPHEDCYVPVK